MALRKFGFEGGVFPVTRSHEVAHGFACYPRVEDVPDPVDLAVLCMGPAGVPDALVECAARGIGCAVVFASGFSAVSAAGASLRDELRRVVASTGVRVLGPNT